MGTGPGILRVAVAGLLLVAAAGPAAAQGATTQRVSASSTGAQGLGYSDDPALSADGRYVAFSSEASNLVPGDTNDTYDVFVRDQQTGTTSRVSVSGTGEQGSDYSYDPAISADGRYVTFASGAWNLVPGDTNDTTDVFVRDRRTGTTGRVSVSGTGEQGNGESFSPVLSADGRYVAFDSDASNLVPGDTNDTNDVFVRDRVD
jgi:Tol biopolymer transport system component